MRKGREKRKRGEGAGAEAPPLEDYEGQWPDENTQCGEVRRLVPFSVG